MLNRHPPWDTDYICFELIELYLNEGVDANGNYPSFESVRTYNRRGELHGVSDLDDRCRKHFVGRDDPIEGVSEGDFCWLVGYRTIAPILYDKAPMTRAEVKSRFKNGYAGDFTDDSGLAFTVDSGHEHPSPLYVFPLSALPFADLSEELKSKMLDFRERYYAGGAV